MRLSLLLSLLPAIALALPTADHSAYTLFESHPAPEGWHQLSTLPSPSTPITLRFHLRTSYADLERELLTVSDPSHPRYGDHLSREALFALTAPVEGAVDVVGDWLKDTTSDVTVDGDVIKVRLTLAEAEELLHTKYSAFQNDEAGKTLVRTLSYSVPEAVKPYVATVQPTNMFTLRNLRSNIVPLDKSAAMNQRLSADVEAESKSDFSVAEVTEQAQTSCNSTVTLDCLANLYGFAGYDATGEADIGISGFLEQYAQYADLEIFLENYKPEAAGANFSVVSVNGGLNLQHVSGTDNISEANLDIQYALGISYPANNTYYTTAGRPPFIPDLVSLKPLWTPLVIGLTLLAGCDRKRLRALPRVPAVLVEAGEAPLGNHHQLRRERTNRATIIPPHCLRPSRASRSSWRLCDFLRRRLGPGLVVPLQRRQQHAQISAAIPRGLPLGNFGRRHTLRARRGGVLQLRRVLRNVGGAGVPEIRAQQVFQEPPGLVEAVEKVLQRHRPWLPGCGRTGQQL
jgi:hypothetical protein